MAQEPIPFLEATITDVHARMRSGQVRCEQLVQWYLARIEQYDRQGPALHAIVNVNQAAREQAAALDLHLQKTGSFKGPLHGVPVLVKDQGETDFMPTTFGSKAYADYRPARNATVVQKLQDAGAVILAKASMCDFAAGWFSFSSVTDRTRNPYAPERDAGGSSAGTGAGIAANFALVGIGEDTGGSIRIPASFNSLYGLRVTTGLISRTGFSPLLHFQDTPGPMARSVRDLAKLLDVLVGYDPQDPFTCAATLARDAGSYEKLLDGADVRGARIGVLRQGFGPDDDGYSRPVNAVVRSLVQRLAQRGAELVEVDLPDVQDWISRTSLYIQASKHDLNRFMATRVTSTPHSFESIYEKRWFHPLNDLFHNLAAGPADPDAADGYYKQRVAQAEFQRLILNLYAQHRLDFLMYPDVKVLPPTYADLEGEKWTCLTFPTNTVIASQSHLPALSMPAGFTQDEIPVGVELVARPYEEAALLRFAYAYEQFAHPRRPPPMDSRAG
jgi:Asp-tRNA(Asn)/Glu-tRNA(Gln) amidotransferase A subunit family amidase